MTSFPYLTFFIIFAILIFADKALTYVNLTQIQKNFPKADALAAEKNPMARWLFEKTGLIGGSIAMFVFQCLVAAFALFLISRMTHPQIGTYVIFMILGAVVLNNTYFLLKYSKVIP